MKIQLPDSISSLSDLKALLVDVREYARWYSHNAVKKRLGAKHPSQPPTISPAAEELLRNWATKNPLNTKSIDALISGLEEQIDSAPSLTITLAAPPSSGLKKSLVGWCRTNIQPDILVNFQFNTTLLGGMVVRYGSRVYDWSFRRQILENRAKFAEVLRNV